MKVKPLIVPLAVTICVACGSSTRTHVVRVSTYPWPEGPGPVVAAKRRQPGIFVPLRDVAADLPSSFPTNPPQHCAHGAKVEITFSNGRTIRYGPCARPRVIERLRIALMNASRKASPAHYWTTQPGTVPSTVRQPPTSMRSRTATSFVAIAAFRIVGLGHPIPSEIDRGPCPQGRWSQALYAAHALRRVGTLYGCGLAISKGSSSHLDPEWIHQTAREQFVLPGRSLTAVCDERFRWRDAHYSHATFRCRVQGGGTIRGAGDAVNGRANYLLRFTPQ